MHFFRAVSFTGTTYTLPRKRKRQKRWIDKATRRRDAANQDDEAMQHRC